MLENTNVKEINDAIVVLREVSADEKMRYLAEMREKALHDEANALHSAEKKGMKKGMERGMEKGRAEGIIEGETKAKKAIVEKLKQKGMSEEDIKALLED